MSSRGVGRAAAIAALACTLMAVHCPGSSTSGSTTTTSSTTPAPEKRLPNFGGGGKADGGLLGGMKTHTEPGLGSSSNHVSAPSFEWNNRSPGVPGRHHP